MRSGSSTLPRQRKKSNTLDWSMRLCLGAKIESRRALLRENVAHETSLA